jgi:hypothetical protein
VATKLFYNEVNTSLFSLLVLLTSILVSDRLLVLVQVKLVLIQPLVLLVLATITPGMSTSTAEALAMPLVTTFSRNGFLN